MYLYNHIYEQNQDAPLIQDLPGYRPEVVFIGRVNSGKSSMINAPRRPWAPPETFW